MGAIEELKEHMEHAAHVAHDEHGAHKGDGRLIGVTMASLGVMLALCAAMLGSERTELIRTMVEQSTRFGTYQAETMKYRVIDADYKLLMALSPKADEIKKMEATLRSKRAPSGKADDEDTAELKDLIASSAEDMAALLTPDADEKDHFRKLAQKYKLDMAEAKEDAEAYDLKIDAHQEGAEGYERAQLAAEIGIVIASVALLLSSRKVWLVSLVLAVACVGVGGLTFVHTRAQLVAADEKIHHAKEHTLQIEGDDAEEDKGGQPEPGGTAAPHKEAPKPEHH